MPDAFYRQDIQANTISILAAGEQTPFVNVLVAVDMHQTRQLKTEVVLGGGTGAHHKSFKKFLYDNHPLY